MLKETTIFICSLFLLVGCNEQERNKYRDRPLSMEDSIANKMQADSGRLDTEDVAFVTAVITSGMVETEAGKLASEKSADTAIQSYGKLLITQHQQLSKDLKDIVAQRRVDVPERLDEAQDSKLDRLRNTSGKAFDRAFIQQMIEDHTTAVTLFDQAGASGKDVHIQAFANKNIPIIRNHLRIAKELSNSLK